MDPKQFVETRTKRYMAQALEEFEDLIEHPLRRGVTVNSNDIERVKSTFRKKLQTLASDCLDVMPSDLPVEINALELVRR